MRTSLWYEQLWWKKCDLQLQLFSHLTWFYSSTSSSTSWQNQQWCVRQLLSWWRNADAIRKFDSQHSIIQVERSVRYLQFHNFSKVWFSLWLCQPCSTAQAGFRNCQSLPLQCARSSDSRHIPLLTSLQSSAARWKEIQKVWVQLLTQLWLCHSQSGQCPFCVANNCYLCTMDQIGGPLLRSYL